MLLNSGEYDWVLTEISQAHDRAIAPVSQSRMKKARKKASEFLANEKEFSIQLIEDNASSGYLHILSALACNDPSQMRRFVSDRLFEELAPSFETRNERLVYDRLFLNHVSLIGAEQKEGKNLLFLLIRSSFKQVVLSEAGEVLLADPIMKSKSEVIVLERDISCTSAKGSLYAYTCPVCGAPVEDTLEAICGYCNQALNSSNHEWIISDIMDLARYIDSSPSDQQQRQVHTPPKVLDKQYHVKDYAFNNMLVILGSDREFDVRERMIASDFAKKFGVDAKRIQGMFNLAAHNKLPIRMPEEHAARKKVYDLMLQAANADQRIAKEEMQLLLGFGEELATTIG